MLLRAGIYVFVVTVVFVVFVKVYDFRISKLSLEQLTAWRHTRLSRPKVYLWEGNLAEKLCIAADFAPDLGWVRGVG